MVLQAMPVTDRAAVRKLVSLATGDYRVDGGLELPGVALGAPAGYRCWASLGARDLVVSRSCSPRVAVVRLPAMQRSGLVRVTAASRAERAWHLDDGLREGRTVSTSSGTIAGFRRRPAHRARLRHASSSPLPRPHSAGRAVPLGLDLKLVEKQP